MTLLVTMLSLLSRRGDPTHLGFVVAIITFEHTSIYFREEQQKVNLVWHDDGTISYNRRKVWHFEPSMSVGPLTDSVVSLNLPMVTAVNYARRSFMMEFGLSDMLATIEAKLFLNRTVGELLFDGYDDPILEIGASFDDEERTLPIDKFGWFYKVCVNINI